MKLKLVEIIEFGKAEYYARVYDNNGKWVETTKYLGDNKQKAEQLFIELTDQYHNEKSGQLFATYVLKEVEI